MRYITILIVAVLATTACHNKKEMMAYSRDKAYYDDLANNSNQSPQAAQNLKQMKMIETGSDYPMRFVLFNDNTFYYQIDRLGNGYGFWNYQEGGVQLTASRPIFDMLLYVSARSEKGDDLVVRFVDRHGFNTVNADIRAPAASAEDDLDEFTESDKGI